MNEALKLIKTRRSTFPKSYTDEVIEKSIIEDILESANWAPTHKLTQPWRFIVFSGEGLKKLGESQSELYKTVTQKRGTFDEGLYEKLKSKPLKASHVIAIIMKRDERVPEVEEIASIGAAVQNMYLTATSYELGCYWGTGGITYFDETKDLFSLEAGDRFMGFFFLGKMDGPYHEGRRDPISEKTEWVEDK